MWKTETRDIYSTINKNSTNMPIYGLIENICSWELGTCSISAFEMLSSNLVSEIVKILFNCSTHISVIKLILLLFLD